MSKVIDFKITETNYISAIKRYFRGSTVASIDVNSIHRGSKVFAEHQVVVTSKNGNAYSFIFNKRYEAIEFFDMSRSISGDMYSRTLKELHKDFVDHLKGVKKEACA